MNKILDSFRESKKCEVRYYPTYMSFDLICFCGKRNVFTFTYEFLRLAKTRPTTPQINNCYYCMQKLVIKENLGEYKAYKHE